MRIRTFCSNKNNKLLHYFRFTDRGRTSQRCKPAGKTANRHQQIMLWLQTSIPANMSVQPQKLHPATHSLRQQFFLIYIPPTTTKPQTPLRLRHYRHCAVLDILYPLLKLNSTVFLVCRVSVYCTLWHQKFRTGQKAMRIRPFGLRTHSQTQYNVFLCD